jgi:hypothetical protein
MYPPKAKEESSGRLLFFCFPLYRQDVSTLGAQIVLDVTNVALTFVRRGSCEKKSSVIECIYLE